MTNPPLHCTYPGVANCLKDLRRRLHVIRIGVNGDELNAIRRSILAILG